LPRTARRDDQGWSGYLTLASAPSQAYEAYLIGADGRITMRVDLHCADDEAAKQSANQFADSNDVELWQQDRRIATFRPDP
jgi:hypothetical protein